MLCMHQTKIMFRLFVKFYKLWLHLSICFWHAYNLLVQVNSQINQNIGHVA